MTHVKVLSEHAHDDVVELFFALGLFSSDQAENRELFGAVHSIVWRRMQQLEDRVREDMLREFQKTLAHDRAARFRLFREPSRS